MNARLAHHWLDYNYTRIPDHVAIEHAGQTLTYHELLIRADAVAAHLMDIGCQPGEIIALDLPRSVDQIVAMLGSLRAGLTYLPLEWNIAPHRLSSILATAAPKYCFSNRGIFGESEVRCISVPRDVTGQKILQEPVRLNADASAYVLFTSGSTGEPKGVLMGHQSLAKLIHWNRLQFEGDGNVRTLQFAPLSFDVSFQEIFATFACGGTLVLMEETVRRDPFLLHSVLLEHGITHLFLPTPALASLARAAIDSKPLDALRAIICAGDQLIVTSEVRQWFRTIPFCRLENHYGPTETHVVTAYTMPADISHWLDRPPIGSPLPHVTIKLVDSALDPVAAGSPGELLLGGECLAQGYLKRPDLTAERFIESPIHGRMYRTSDVACCDSSGVFHFAGRLDRQVKIRGHRIELDEIEAVLAQHPLVAACAVVAIGEAGHDRKLAAYVEPIPSAQESGLERLSSADIPELEQHLKQALPDYMMPGYFRVLPKLPMTPSGKVDRARLPAPSKERPPLEVAYTPPSTSMEIRIAEIWGTLLPIERIGLDDSFFALGGTSLLAMKLQALVSKQLGRRFTIAEIFAQPTIRSFAALFTSETSDSGQTAPHSVRHTLESNRLRRADVVKREAGRVETDIAIIGLSCRFPGAPNIRTFWDNLANGRESIHRQVSSVGAVEAASTLPAIEWFDAKFFGISAHEAELIDPQQRLFLECAWEAMEDSGYSFRNSPFVVGTYGGAGMSTYLLNHLSRTSNLRDLISSTEDLALLLANAPDFLTARVGYKLDLRGPCVNIQAACATSLFAVHNACQALISNECDIALAGAVCVPVPQILTYQFEEGMVFSPDGFCRPYDAQANGTVFGSGGGMVVLKRLEQAIHDQDDIYAIIKGSAINNDGSRKMGMAAPSVNGQAEVIERALRMAGVGADSIGFVEGHGTATALGDPIEVAALTRAFDGVPAGNCALGSVKSNVGHLGWAAGMAGLIKAVLALKNRKIPGTLHFNFPNPELYLESSPFYVNASVREWAAPAHNPRRSAVSAFGLGGANAHVVLQEAPAPPLPEIQSTSQIFALSARTPAALYDLAGRYSQYLNEHTDISLADIAFTLNCGRTHQECRVALVAGDKMEFARQLAALAPNSEHSSSSAGIPLKIAFIFSGQGSEYFGMGRRLYELEPVFRRAIDAGDDIFRDRFGVTVHEVLYETAESLPQIMDLSLAQPLMFALQVALGRLWMAWGVQPTALMGHSVGEFAAAHLAEVFDFSTGLNIVAERGRLIQSLEPDGAMLAVFAEAAVVHKHLVATKSNLAIAAVNGPLNTVVAGRIGEIAAFEAVIRKERMRCRNVPVARAGHSHLMEPILDEFEAYLNTVKFQLPQLPLISNLTGEFVSAGTMSPQYWRRHLRDTVQFEDGCKRLVESGINTVLEIGPASTLLSLAASIFPTEGTRFLPSLDQKKEDHGQMYTTLAKLYTSGLCVNWEALFEGRVRRRVHLPTYPFQRQRYWREDPANQHDTAEMRISRERAHAHEDWQSMVFRVCWQRVGADGKGGSKGDNWLILEDRAGSARAFVHLLEQAGHRCRIVPAQESQRLPELLREAEAHYGYVVDARPLDLPRFTWDFEGVMDVFQQGCESTLELIKTVLTVGNILPKVWLLTRDAQYVHSGDEVQGVGTAPLLGLSKVTAIEHPELRLRRIDLSASSTIEEDGEALLAAFDINEKESELACRAEGVYVPRLKKSPPDNSKCVSLRNDACYLITGGLGALGPYLAERLAKAGAGTIILCGRRPPGASTVQRIQAMETTGTRVFTKQVDISKQEDVKELFYFIGSLELPLRGIIHAAVVLDDGVLQSLDWGRFAHVLAPKALGAWNLHVELMARKIEPDFFVMFSSATSLIGNSGQSNYAAANAFLDALACHRRGLGMAGHSINWGPWTSLGFLAKRQDIAERLLNSGMGSLSTEAGLRAFEHLCAEDGPQSGVLTNEWPLFLREHQLSQVGFFEMLAANSPDLLRTDDSLINALRAAPTGGRHALLSSWVDAQLTTILGSVWSESGNDERPFSKFGLDSLAAIQFRNRLQRELQFPLPATLMFVYPTLTKLCTYLSTLPLDLSRTEDKALAGCSGIELSCQQERWLSLINKGYGKRVVPIIFDAVWNVNNLHRALSAVVEKRELLRYRFNKQNAELQSVEETVPSAEDLCLDLSQLGRPERASAFASLVDAMSGRVRNPSETSSWEIKLIRTAERQWIALLSLQHLEFDGTSLSTFVDDFRAAYKALNRGAPPDLDEIAPYAEYVRFQREYLRNGIQQDRSFFQGVFSSLAAVRTLPGHSGYFTTTVHPSKRYTPSIISNLWSRVQNASMCWKVTPFSILLAAYSRLAAELLSCGEVVIAMITGGRTDARFSKTIGPFTSPFPVRILVGTSASKDLAVQCNQLTADINARAHYPVADLTHHVNAFNGFPHDSYFSDFGINFTNYRRSAADDEVNAEVVEILGPVDHPELIEIRTGQLQRIPGLHLVAEVCGEQLRTNFWYHEHRFDADTIGEWSNRFHQLLDQIVNETMDKQSF